MMTTAAGMAACGKTVFASTFAMFAAGRAYEQIRNSIAYPNLHVIIGATHSGVLIGEDGASHQCNEDIALMRTIPGMVVMCPADDVEAKAAVKAAYELEGPVYLRFGRLAVPVINDNPDYRFEIGKGVVLREGTDLTIVATGLCVSSALDAADLLAAEGISVRVIIIHTIKPLDEETVRFLLKEYFRDAKDAALEQFAGVFLDLQTKAYNGEISTKPLDLRGLISAIAAMRSGLSPIHAIHMGIVNKSFDVFEKEIIGDAVGTRVPSTWTRADIFEG